MKSAPSSAVVDHLRCLSRPRRAAHDHAGGSDQSHPPAIGWRLAFGWVDPRPGVLIIRCQVPESPRWLFIHGHEDDGERIVGELEDRMRAEDHELAGAVGKLGYFVGAVLMIIGGVKKRSSVSRPSGKLESTSRRH